MELKFIQVNIYKGRYLNELIKFLISQKPDFIAMQEVTGGEISFDKGKNLFEILKERLNLFGIFSKDFDVENPSVGFQGNAVFSRHKIIRQDVLVLKKPAVISLGQVNDSALFAHTPRHLLNALCSVGEFKVNVMSWHGAWTAPPVDTEETMRQAKMVADYLKNLNSPFILGGDLNALIQSRTVDTLNRVANNLMLGSGVLQTTHPKLHKIVPRGYLIDYIFTSKHFKKVSLEVPQIVVSDHLPVVAKLRVR